MTPVPDDNIALARSILQLTPYIGRIWALAARETGTLSVDRLKTLGNLSRLAPVRAGEFAEVCHLSPAAVTHAVDALVEDGFVRREPDPADRRVVILHVTPKGRHELERAERIALAKLARALDQLEPTTRVQLRDALPKLEGVLARREGEDRKVPQAR